MDDLAGQVWASGGWLQPRVRPQGAVRYIQTIRDRWWLVLVAVLVALLAALLYLATAPKVYRAEADLLITPASAGDSSLSGLGLVTESTDPTQDISTAARLARTPSVAQATASALGGGRSGDDVLAKVTVEPVAQSNLVAVEAQAGSASAAAALANAFAKSAVAVRTDQLHREIAAILPRLRTQLEDVPVDQQTGPGSLGERIASLQALSSASDPTIRLATEAEPPTSPSSPKPKLAVAAGLLGGLIVGVGAAFALQALDPRLRRDEQLRELFRLPLLARIPDVHDSGPRRAIARIGDQLPLSARTRPGPLTPERLTPQAVEAYRTLRATLSVTLRDARRSILITSSSAAEGKTTTALNLAASLAHTGEQVILLEGDMRRPTLAAALGVRPALGIGTVLIKRAELEDALVTVPEYGPNLRFLLAEPAATVLADRLSLPTASELVTDAEVLADWVVIDSPPLTEVVDALPLAQQVGGVVVVARLHASRLNRLADLGEILVQGGVTPAGVAVVGETRATESASYPSLATSRVPVG